MLDGRRSGFALALGFDFDFDFGSGGLPAEGGIGFLPPSAG